MGAEMALPRAVPALLVGALGVMTAVLAVACGSSQPGQAATPASQPVQEVTIKVTTGDAGKVGPDGKHHDTFTPADITLKSGVPVKLIFLSEDPATHSFTVNDLGINVIVNGGKPGQPATTTYSFTPSKAGQFRWFCAIPCDDAAGGWAMTAGSRGTGQDGFMAGYVTVT